jgi:hypothetical protein
MKLSEKIMNILDMNGWYIVTEPTLQNDEFYVEIGNTTPAGEDWIVIVYYDGTNESFYNAIKERYDTFDIDDEAEPYIANRGKYGIPSSIKTLIHDAEYKLDALQALYYALDNAI